MGFNCQKSTYLGLHVCGCADADTLGKRGIPFKGSDVSEERRNNELGNKRQEHIKKQTREEEVRTAITNSGNGSLSLRAVLRSSNAATFSRRLKQHKQSQHSW